jgi:regulator of sigma E protease
MTVITIIIAILIFFLLIFVHETGHLLFAKLTGVQVNEFSLGMGPKIAGFRKGETEYVFRALPIGGACVMEGEDEDSENPRAFTAKPARIKALVLFGGSLMNILLAFIVVSMIIFSLGEVLTVLDSVTEGSPAAADGLREGDKIIAIDGHPVEEWSDVPALLNDLVAGYGDTEGNPVGAQESNGGDPSGNEENPATEEAITPSGIPVTLFIGRDGETKTIETELYYNAEGSPMIGILPRTGHSPAYFFKSFGYGVRASGEMMRMMYEVLGQLVTGRASIDNLTGPVGIVVTVGETVRYGAVYVWQLLALISLNLGIVNLLPFPALDGGRLLFLLIRKITGRVITNRAEGVVHLIGIMILFGFMIFITFHDVDRFFLS